MVWMQQPLYRCFMACVPSVTGHMIWDTYYETRHKRQQACQKIKPNEYKLMELQPCQHGCFCVFRYAADLPTLKGGMLLS